MLALQKPWVEVPIQTQTPSCLFNGGKQPLEKAFADSSGCYLSFIVAYINKCLFSGVY